MSLDSSHSDSGRVGFSADSVLSQVLRARTRRGVRFRCFHLALKSQYCVCREYVVPLNINAFVVGLLVFLIDFYLLQWTGFDQDFGLPDPTRAWSPKAPNQIRNCSARPITSPDQTEAPVALVMCG